MTFIYWDRRSAKLLANKQETRRVASVGENKLSLHSVMFFSGKLQIKLIKVRSTRDMWLKEEIQIWDLDTNSIGDKEEQRCTSRRTNDLFAGGIKGIYGKTNEFWK